MQYTDNGYSMVSVYLKSASEVVSYDIGHTCGQRLPRISLLCLSILIEVRHLFCWVTHSGLHVVREITYYMPVTIHCYIDKIR